MTPRAALPLAWMAALGTMVPATAGQAPQFRASVDLVQIDVSVLDRNRRPVRGLTASDFIVEEDGKPQPVLAFSAIDLPDPLPVSTPWMREVAPDVRRNDDLGERRLVILVMDDATIPFDVAMANSARVIGRKVIDRLGPADLAAVVFTRDNRNGQDFTDDRTRLLTAVDSFKAGSRALDGGIEEVTHLVGSVETLRKAAEYLAGIAQRRKALIFVSVGVPADAETAGAPSSPGLTEGKGSGIAIAGMHSQIIARMQETFRGAQRANVNIYAVDPAGLGGMEQYIQSQRWQGKAVPPYERANNYLDFLNAVAENTGGRAFTNTNEFDTGIAQIFAENGSYYLLGYRSPNPAADGKFRRLEVSVTRPGLTVRARTGYRAESADAARKAPATPEASATTALVGLLPKTDIKMVATAAAFPIARTKTAAVAIVLGMRQDAPARPAPVVERVALVVTALTQNGKAQGTHRMDARIDLRAGEGGPVQYEVLSRIDLAPGRYQLRVAADSSFQKKSGSVFIDLDVPDFSKAALTMSDVVLTVSPRVAVAPRDRLTSLLPVIPTTQRSFGTGDRVSAFARVSNGAQTPASPVAVVVKVTDATGRVVYEQPRTLGAERFAGGIADVQIDVPIANLRSGPHMLTVEASVEAVGARPASPALQRHVRFTVR